MLLFACASPEAPVVPAASVWVEARKVDEGAAIRLHAPDAATLQLPEGLSATDVGEGAWELRGAKGSWIVEVEAEGEKTALYLDIGVDGPSGGPMEDLAALPPPPPPRWPWILGGFALAGLAVALFAWARKALRRPAPPPLPDPPDVVARRAWRALRARSDLDAETLARELSAVYRAYVEARHGWPATQRTTREILDNLAAELSAAQLDRARRLLGAMDLVKFAEREAHADIFDALDQDFEELVRA